VADLGLRGFGLPARVGLPARPHPDRCLFLFAPVISYLYQQLVIDTLRQASVVTCTEGPPLFEIVKRSESCAMRELIDVNFRTYGTDETGAETLIVYHVYD